MIRLCRWCSKQLDVSAVDWCDALCGCAYYLERGAFLEARTIANANHIAWADVEKQQRDAQWWCVECGSVPVKHRGSSCDNHGSAGPSRRLAREAKQP